MANIDRSPSFVPVTCQCGRSLRAKFDQVGSEIQCWDCHKMVVVPMPRQGQRIARELSENALDVINGPGLNVVMAAAIPLTVVMAIPYWGPWVAIIGLTLGASAYGEIVRRVSRGPVEGREPGWTESLLPRSFPRALLCLAMAAGTILPLWILNARLAEDALERRAPHFNAIGWIIAAASWTILPVLMVISYARDREGGLLRPRTVLTVLSQHPVATALALGVIPATLALMEATFALFTHMLGDLTFLVLDFMPIPTQPDPPLIYAGLPYFRFIDYRSFPDSKFIAFYFDALRHGYSFVAAIPASLSMPTRAGLTSEAIGIYPPIYSIGRGLIAYMFVSGLMTAFAIQARWLGTIPSLRKGRPA